MELSSISGNVFVPASKALVSFRELGEKITTTEPNTEAKSTKPHHQDDVDAAVNTLNEIAATLVQNIQFSVEKETGKTVVKVVDVETNEVLRQIPSVEALEIARSLHKMQGLLIHEKA